MCKQPKDTNAEVWYAKGLRFQCKFPECMNCCGGEPGYVWLTDGEPKKIADHLGISEKEFLKLYTFKTKGRLSLTEKKDFDCIFLDRKTGCQIYEARPEQCSSYPFWPEVLGSVEAWVLEGHYCPGINRGEVVSFDKIQELREKKLPPLL